MGAEWNHSKLFSSSVQIGICEVGQADTDILFEINANKLWKQAEMIYTLRGWYFLKNGVWKLNVFFEKLYY